MAMNVDIVEDIVKRLTSDTSKCREGGLKHLKLIADTADFARVLDDQTQLLLPEGTSTKKDIAPSTWPGLLDGLCVAIERYVDRTNKKKPKPTKKKPKPTIEYAKAMRTLIKHACAADRRQLVLVLTVDDIYAHLVRVITHFPGFQTDYCAVVLELLSHHEYRLLMETEQYTELVEFLLKPQAQLNDDTFLSIVKNPPKALPESTTRKVASKLSHIFAHTSDIKAGLKRLLETVTSLLRHDGPNLGNHLLEIHSGAKKCLSRSWPMVTDVATKDMFVRYLRMQLKLRCIIMDDEADNLGELFDFVVSELDGKFWNTKAVPLVTSTLSLLLFGAHVIFEYLIRDKPHTANSSKRRKNESATVLIADRLTGVKPLWAGAVCLLLRHYGPKLPQHFLSDVFKPLVHRLPVEVLNVHETETPLWIIRCLNELCNLGCCRSSQDASLWQSVWEATIKWIMLMSTAPVLVEDALKMLSYILLMSDVPAGAIPDELWDLHVFRDKPTGSALFFVSVVFSSTASQDFNRRKSLLAWAMKALRFQAGSSAEHLIPPKLLSGTFLSLSTGALHLPAKDAASFLRSWLENSEQNEGELRELDLGDDALTSSGVQEIPAADGGGYQRTSLVRRSHSDALLDILGKGIEQLVQEVKSQRVECLLHASALVAYCFLGAEASMKGRGQRSNVWSRDGEIFTSPTVLIGCCTLRLEKIEDSAEASKEVTQGSVAALRELTSAVRADDACLLFSPHLFRGLLKALRTLLEDGKVAESASFTSALADDELDAPKEDKWKVNCLSMICGLGRLNPEVAYNILQDLLSAAVDVKLRDRLMACLCDAFTLPDTLLRLEDLAKELHSAISRGGDLSRSNTLTATQVLLSKLATEKEISKHAEALSNIRKIIEAIPKSPTNCATLSKLAGVTSALIRLDAQFAKGVALLDLLESDDLRVRVVAAGRLHVLFETSNDHRELLKNVESKLGVTLPSSQPSGSKESLFTKTAVLALGEAAAASEQVEAQVVCKLLAQAAVQPTHRTLIISVLDNVAERVGYCNRFEFLKQLLRTVFYRCVASSFSLQELLKVNDILVPQLNGPGFLEYCIPFILPPLLLHGNDSQIRLIAQERATSVKSLIEDNFAPIYAVLASLACAGHETASAVLRSDLLTTQVNRQHLVDKHMLSIARNIILLVDMEPELPSISKATAVAAISTIASSIFKDMNQQEVNEFVFETLLRIHVENSGASHWRHKRHSLEKLDAFLDVVGDGIAVPSTFRYFMHIILQSIGMADLQPKCCSLINAILDKLEAGGSRAVRIFGENLEALVSKLVSCTSKGDSVSPPLLGMLHRVTIDADLSLSAYVKELNLLPDLPCFKSIREFQANLRSCDTFPDEFVKFVQRAPSIPSQQRLSSLRHFCDRLRDTPDSRKHFLSDAVVSAVWELVLSCNDEHDDEFKNLTASFLAAVGIRNVDAVAFRLPRNSDKKFFRTSRVANVAEPSENILQLILTQLCSYLLDTDVSVIDLAYQTAKGLLATTQGPGVLSKLNEQERGYLETLTGGPNEQLVQRVLKLNASNLVNLADPSVWSTGGKCFEAWICPLVHALIGHTKDTFLRLCQRLVLVKAAFAELLLPYTLWSLAELVPINSPLYAAIVKQVQDHIFSDSNRSTRSMQLFLDAFNSLRLCHVNARAATRDDTMLARLKWPKVYWLNVDYLLTAKAAQKCAAYFTAVLYVEHWCEEKYGSLVLQRPEDMVMFQEKLPEHVERLLSVYTKVNEPDCVYGVVGNHHPASQVRIYEHEGNWAKALETYDLLLSSSDDPEILKSYYKGVVRALHRSGCSRVRDMYSTGLTGLKDSTLELLDDEEFKELEYEAAWASGKWNLNFDMNLVGDDSLKLGFHGNLLSSLQCLEEGDLSRFQTCVKRMKEDAVAYVAHTSLESTQNVYPSIIKLQIVDRLPYAWSIRWPSSGLGLPTNSQVAPFFSRWREISRQTRRNYNLWEPFGSFLKVLLQVLKRHDCLPIYLLEYAALARKAGRLNQAAGAIQEIKNLCKEDNCSSFLRSGHIEEAKILWAQGERDLAVTLVKYLLRSTGSPDSMALQCLAGKWLVQTRSASSRVILETYLEKAAACPAPVRLDAGDFMKRRSKSHFHLAHFAYALHQSYADRLASKEWVTEENLRSVQEVECKTLKDKAKKSRDQDTRYSYTAKALELFKELKMDKLEVQRTHDSMAHLLDTCLKSYRTCLMSSDKYDMRVVFRLVALWFGNVVSAGIISDMIKTVKEVPSFKFIPLVYQIASRMGNIDKPNDLTSAVAMLVRKMATEHPYHSLYQLFALANGDRIKENQNRKTSFVVDLDKKRAAEVLLEELSNSRPEMTSQVREMVDVYIQLAELPVTQEDWGKTVPYPGDTQSVRRLHLVPVLTADVAIDRSCRYRPGSFPFFQQFEGDLSVMKGVNCPKTLTCRGSDGKLYRQLAKSGSDDLRQDAVMEQLFGLVNILLKDHPETRNRCLHIRTYKVVPFTPSAGALQWVDGTLALGEYLLGSPRRPGIPSRPGAHTRYGNGDWTFVACRDKMIEDPKESLVAFKTVCKNFRPVFRHFFRERFFRAADWFEKRLNYTRSVATSSMVGYIVGLGDRHASNILIDEASAEVIHIDLGVAFDQGLMLKTPETVPFRLTRDIVDGMGVTGVEGVFRRCCEATLSVLRANKEALHTIVEVFIHDPLYRWALSPLKALQKQEDVAEYEPALQELGTEGNRDATRALLRLDKKLDGYHDGENRTVECQVQQLVQDAQDPENLSLLFFGWAAWL